ncbi:MAG: hypothetical protein EAZ09_09530 [Oscillatoriales cyanobacterium]|nr:MAG: hypothetical protein EAZ18_23675 [Oscillatoriales cyanobacterium]TAH22825.1 MAG: hypothetical protein EAZ09_09530 [Oscillatoriales cyanobacterium]
MFFLGHCFNLFVGWALGSWCGTIANCVLAHYCLDVNSNLAEFLVPRDLQLWTTKVDRFSIFDF